MLKNTKNSAQNSIKYAYAAEHKHVAEHKRSCLFFSFFSLKSSALQNKRKQRFHTLLCIKNTPQNTTNSAQNTAEHHKTAEPKWIILGQNTAENVSQNMLPWSIVKLSSSLTNQL